MASFKEMQQTSRPLSHRPSVSSNPIPALSIARQPHSRTNSHSLLSGSLNSNHRVTRRKSMTNTGANVAALAAALQQESGDKAMPLPISINARRNTISRNGLSRSAVVGSLPSPPASLPTHKFVTSDGTVNMQDSAIDDEVHMSGDEGNNSSSGANKSRNRRASDGQSAPKEGIRKINRPELRCEKCGKGYKHSSCLTKHLWEHTPEWSYTSKLLISKHQQVQLLEAASVLVAMNNKPTTGTTPPDSTHEFHSDQDSASPAASGYSDQPERSSADTTPPPQLDTLSNMTGFPMSFTKRQSTGSGFAQSYQSAAFGSSVAGSVPVGSPFGGHFRQLSLMSSDQRPTSSGRNATGKEDRDLAAAVEGLSCSFNSNAGPRSFHLSADAPPVPPLPNQYLGQSLGLPLGSFINSYPSRAPESFTRGELRQSYRNERDDVKMDEDSVMDYDDEEDMRSRARSDEDDDGVFGRMEE
ncbi:hypothetical protein QBC45DRAFT_38202 [Copromyces sp. CBS 386.78]|nr:hypothetical protein QBC45DRAFT_38202 [Copromyces sp. CBS 386.78]